MIDSIYGEVIRIAADHAVVDTGGIAYQAFCPADTLRNLAEGRSALVYTHLIWREDAIQLFGFSTTRERELFRQLLTVGQVGPRLALQLLSTLPPDAFVAAIASNDVDRLTSVKGIGKKTAQRILIDLRDKVASSSSQIDLLLTRDEETALQALTSRALGFSPREAREALAHLRGEGLPAEQLVRRALEILGSR